MHGLPNRIAAFVDDSLGEALHALAGATVADQDAHDVIDCADDEHARHRGRRVASWLGEDRDLGVLRRVFVSKREYRDGN